MWMGAGYVAVIVLGVMIIVISNILAYLGVRDMGQHSPVSHEPVLTLRGGFLLLLGAVALFVGTGLIFIARPLFSPY